MGQGKSLGVEAQLNLLACKKKVLATKLRPPYSLLPNALGRAGSSVQLTELFVSGSHLLGGGGSSPFPWIGKHALLAPPPNQGDVLQNTVQGLPPPPSFYLAVVASCVHEVEPVHKLQRRPKLRLCLVASIRH